LTDVIAQKRLRAYPIYVIKKVCLALLALALSSSAHAAFQLVSLPALPSMPLSMPSALPSRPVALPTLPGGASVVLPGVSNLPKIAPTLPQLPMPVIGKPTTGLPGPANPMPVMPAAQVSRKSFAIATVRFAAPAGQPAAEQDQAQREKLERIFDGTQSSGRADGRDEVRHTIPENDLLNEIGIQ
jgi:hypothetical protein